MNGQEKERTFLGVWQLSLRSLIIGCIGSAIITASSMYTALRMSALPWPTIFVAVLSMGLLKLLGKTTLNEINITKTAMSAGAMVAGGLAFTLPGLWISGVWTIGENISSGFFKTLAIAIAGMLLGTVLTWILRYRFIKREALPYPIGAAAAEAIVAGDGGGKKSALLFTSLGVTALFTYLRDSLRVIPDFISIKWLYARNIFVGIWVSPMACGIGYMIGPLYTGVWFLGAVLSYLIIIPLGTAFSVFSSPEAASGFKSTAGIGLMVGTGIGILLSFIIGYVKTMLKKEKSSKSGDDGQKTGKKGRILIVLTVGLAFVFSVASGLSVYASILLIVGVFITTSMAATITGQTGINPMEIFGIIVLLAVRIFVNVDTTGAFFIAACVAVACGYAGDILNDYKAGDVLGTNPTAQLIAEVAGGLVGTVVATAAMFAIINQFGGVGMDKGLPAAQAFAVSQMVSGIGDPVVFATAAILGAGLYLLKVPVMTLGIGMYLPFEISLAVFTGGLIRLIADKVRPGTNESGNILASGMLGGEGITGVTVAIIKMITGG